MKAQKEEKRVLSETLALAWGLGYRIALPIIFFALLGRFLDKKLGTSVVFLLIGILLALASSTFLIYRQLKEILRNENSKS